MKCRSTNVSVFMHKVSHVNFSQICGRPFHSVYAKQRSLYIESRVIYIYGFQTYTLICSYTCMS